MKLLPLAYIAGASAQSGDYDYGTAVDTDRGYDYSYDYDEFGNKKKKNKNTYSGYSNSGYGANSGYYYGGKAIGSNQSIARALNCWPANFDTDNLMLRDPAATNPKENFDNGPLHLYGSEYASVKATSSLFSGDTEDPALRSGLGGHYHYGHAHSSSTEVNDSPSRWTHYKSARHAGCLYEVPDFVYDKDSWNKKWYAWYFNGYYQKAAKATQQPANLDSVTYEPNWVHFFNAHVLTGGPATTSSVPPDTQSDTNAIKLVIANPQYEGLGYLNFVATYRVAGITVGSHYTEFADSTHHTVNQNSDGSSNEWTGCCDTYYTINSVDHQETQGITGNYYFDAWMGTWEVNRDDSVVWETTYTEAASATDFGTNNVAISSFPHNELGKDFRFNLRILLKDTNNTNRMMYYWYKVNHITITFPEYVGYALYYDGRTSTTALKSDGDVTHSGRLGQGSGLYNVGNNDVRKNIIPPLDLGSWYDASFGAHTASTNTHHRIVGYLSTASADIGAAGSCTNCADWCDFAGSNCAIGDDDCDTTKLESHCSKKFYITGLLNSYSERLGGQRGTYQEIWIQLQYAMAIDSLNSHNSNVIGNSNDKISSPFPYLHFMAYQITQIDIGCSVVNVENGNTCGAFAEYGTHDFGWGGR